MTTIRLPVIASAVSEELPAVDDDGLLAPDAPDPPVEPVAEPDAVYLIHCAPSPRLDATDLERVEIVEELPPEGHVRTFIID